MKFYEETGENIQIWCDKNGFDVDVSLMDEDEFIEFIKELDYYLDESD